MPDPLEALRAATAPLHEALDASLPLGQPGAGLGAYAAHLLAVRGWILQLAPCIDAVAPAFAPPEGRLDNIDLDLRDCGVELGPHDSPASLPFKGGPPAFSWGAVYVLEGSALGGLVLRKRLAQALHPHPLRYLAGESDGTSARWRGFIAALRSHVTTPREVGAACDGAVAAFEAFGRHAARSRHINPGASS